MLANQIRNRLQEYLPQMLELLQNLVDRDTSSDYKPGVDGVGEKMAEDIFARMKREGRKEGREEGRAEGRNEVRSDFVRILLKDTSPSEISRKFNIPLSEVRAIERSLRA